jgi:hypothetical protein
MNTDPTMVVQARQLNEDWWTVWFDGKVVGKAWSLGDVLRIAAGRSWPPEEIRWPGRSYQEMVRAGVAPTLPPFDSVWTDAYVGEEPNSRSGPSAV